MAAVNQEQLVGSLIPDVYIKTVTLETTGTPIRETNPHIEHRRESILTAKSPTDNLLIIKLDLLMKEQLDNGLIDTWFSNQDFQKYLRFVVVQSTDPLVTKILSASNNAIQIANINSETEAAVFVAELMEELKELPEFASIGGRAPAYSEEDIPELIELIKENTTARSVSIKEHMLNNKSLLNQQYRSTSSTGAQVFDFTFRLRFEVPTKTPQHLSYFAVSSLDIDQLIEDFNLDASDTHLFELMNGKVAADTVINNGSLVSKSFIFRDVDGNIWSGPVHKSDGGWLTGTAESDIKNPVTKHEVENNKIQDFRDFDAVERLQLDFSVVQNRSFDINIPFKRLTNDNMDVPRSESYFSEAVLARDSRGACRLAFAMDYAKIIRDYTQYGALYSKSNQDELFNNVRIRSFLFKRRRVTKKFISLNQLGSPVEQRDAFDENEPDEILSYAGESKPGQFRTTASPSGTIRELEIKLDSEFDEVRHFTGIDLTMPLITDGFYQYGVEIEVEDKTQNFIRKKVYALARAKYWLDYYYNTATLPNHFDPVSNRFTEEFIEKMYSIYGWETDQKPLTSSPWIRPLITYLSILSFFRKAPVDLKFAAAMWKYLDPKSGNPRGIAMVQKLVENLMQRVSSAVGINLVERRLGGLRSDSAGNFTSPGAILVPGKPRVKTFKIEYYFSQVFDSNVPKDLGYDYLSRGPLEKESSTDGLRVITGRAYAIRAELETLKYFTSSAPKIDMVQDSITYTENDSIDKTALTFLSPSSVSIGRQGNISLLRNAFDAKNCLKIQSAIANINLAKKSPFMPQLPAKVKKAHSSRQLDREERQIKHQLSSVMANYNCTLVTPQASPFHNMAQLLEVDYEPYTSATDILGDEWMGIDQISVDVLANNEYDEDDTNKNPIPLFAGLAFPLFQSGKGLTQSPVISPDATGEIQAKIKSQFNMEFYNLASPRGAVKAAIKFDNSYATGLSPEPLEEVSTIISGKIKTMLAGLPNQIKSLLLMKTRSAPLRHNWAGGNAPLLQRPSGKAAFILNYKTLVKVEVMVGYEVGVDGAALLKRPIWVPLTHAELQKGGKQNLLCRTVRYEDKAFGIHQAIGMRLQTYNKYFIIVNPNLGTVLIRRRRKFYQDRLSRRINRILRQHRYLSGEYLSTAMVNSRRISSNRARRREIMERLNLSKEIKPTRIV